ncbi:hypothetical protein B296_00022161 [Ensete ventricosum]|uniref:Uncharacterized protein n=1 Tax=Ensete ventricosum TaxID=4639 RepID=A0A427AUQ7_ENSVE|nr:hypothetical protein B296_00022161 [Ensete ventricosum]
MFFNSGVFGDLESGVGVLVSGALLDLVGVFGDLEWGGDLGAAGGGDGWDSEGSMWGEFPESPPMVAFIPVCRRPVVPFPSVFVASFAGVFNATSTIGCCPHRGRACRATSIGWGGGPLLPLSFSPPREEASPRFDEGTGKGPSGAKRKVRLEMLETESPWARLRAHLEMFETESPWERLRARMEMFRTKSPYTTLRARLEMFRSKSPWARLRARLEMLGTESLWARLRAHLEMFEKSRALCNMLSSREIFLRIDVDLYAHQALGKVTRGLAVSHRASIIVLSSSGGAAPVDFVAAEALAAMRSCFNVDSTVTTRRLVEVRKHYYIPSEYELHVPLPGERPYNAFPSGFSLLTDALEAGLSFPTEWTSCMVNNSVPTLSIDEIELVEILQGILSASKGVKDMNEAWLAEAGLSPTPRDALGSTTRVLTKKGKELVELGEAPERGEYLWGALHSILAKQVYECSSGKLMNRVEGDVLSLTEATTLLEVELKAERPKAVAAYKASLGFESGLEKMGRFIYKFGYQVALEWLRGKHSEIAIEQDPFVKCPYDANVEIDLN